MERKGVGNDSLPSFKNSDNRDIWDKCLILPRFCHILVSRFSATGVETGTENRDTLSIESKQKDRHDNLE